jgi:hypothetical protein
VAFFISVITMIAAIQIDEFIPDAAWAQYPIVAIGAFLSIALMRYWVQNEDKWRKFVEDERVRAEAFITQIVREQREAHEKVLHSVSEAQRAAYEEALERFLSASIQKSK